MQASPVLFIALCFFTLLVLIVGVVVMAKGGKFNRKHGNKLMATRVVFQFLALVALAIVYFASRV